MKRAVRVTCAALLCSMALPGAARGQASEIDAWVLPPGVVRVSAGAGYAPLTERFTAGGREALASALQQPLGAAAFAPVSTLAARLDAVLQGGGEPLPDLSQLTLGTPDVQVATGVRTLRMEVAAGVLPRLQLSVAVPVTLGEVLVQRLALAGGTVGANPDAASNAALVADAGAELQAVAASPILPLQGTAVADALQQRVRIATGAELLLPDAESAADASVLNALLTNQLGVDPLESRWDDWRPGDAEVQARMQFAGDTGPSRFPEGDGLRYRGVLSAVARLPTGTAPEAVQLFGAAPAAGVAGWSVAVDNDLFVGQRLWMSAAGRYTRLGEAEVLRLVAPPALPLSASPPVEVTRAAGAVLQLGVAPRFRLTDAIALGAEYAMARQGETTFTGVEGSAVLDEPQRTTHAVGVSARYSTLPVWSAGADVLPLEVVVSWQRTLTGTAGAAAGSFVAVGASLLYPLWGERR